MGVLIEKPSCSPPPLSVFEAKGKPNAAEVERRRKEFPIRVITGLGTDIDRYVSQSPTLVKQISKLKRKDWKIVWGLMEEEPKQIRRVSFMMEKL